MPAHIALFANFCLAFFAFANVSTSRAVLLDVFGLYPYAAALFWAVETIFGGILREFPVPKHLEFDVKELIDMLKRNLLVGTAFRWHELWVGRG